VAQVRRASAATPCRTVRFTRSIKAVFRRPERPNPCKAAVRATSVPRLITCMTRVSLLQRSAFFHLAVDQARSHLPSAYVSPSTSLFPPCPKMSRESIKVAIESVTGKQAIVAGLTLSYSNEPVEAQVQKRETWSSARCLAAPNCLCYGNACSMRSDLYCPFQDSASLVPASIASDVG